MEAGMNSPEKQLKYSIRKVSVGAASVVIGALYLLMGAGIAHAEGVESAREAERAANPTDPEQSGNGETGNKPDLSNTDATANTYNAPVAENPLVAPEAAKPRTRSKRELADGDASNSSNGATGTEAGDNQPTSEDSPALDANRKGETVKEHQPGVHVPKDGEQGGDDKNANLTFDAPKENLTLEQLWDIVKNMPDDFQNNERSYLRNMNTLGDALRFKNGKVSEDGTGDKLQDGEIRELDSFGGWTAIAGKDGRPGKFVIGKKNADGYFTGWYKKEDGTIEQGGMLGGDALDNIYVHEQALDRRFRYMLMLVKGRTRANRDETVSDNSKYDPRAQNERADSAGTPYKDLPFLKKDEYRKYSPGVVGYNGIEKQFTAFSPAFGSRVRVEFVTGYISDINGSKGTYRVVIKTKDTAGQEKTVYDETIHRVAEIVQNENLYKKGLDVELAHKTVLKFFTNEFDYRVNKIRNEKVKNSPLSKVNKNKYTEAQKELYNKFEAEAREEAKKQGDIVLNVTEDFLSIEKSKAIDSEWKKTFTNISQLIAKLSNELNTLLKFADQETPNTPTWINATKEAAKAKADDRAYKLLRTLIPGAKKITYHVKDDQLEVETDKYTYTAARNGSKEAGIQGSNIEATASADEYNANRQTFERENTNTKANALNNGWARADSEEFKHFSHYVGVDKGIVRTKVLTDKELSDKIRDAVGPGDSNLGKGGYFSTGDVLLGKDVVSYTVQVFSENNNRVGVNPQSHRVQYNLPILADFSVIQDTVEPSRNVVEKIIPKLNIPEEEKKKITEEIKKKKKTSELADLISGNVKVRYVDEQGHLLSLKNDTGIGEKESDGTYITNKKQLIGTSYNVTDKKLSSMTTTDGTYYTFKELAANSESLTGDIVREGRTVTLVYRESEAPAEVDATRTVKRTITYVKEDNVNGTIKRTVLEKQTKENTVTFTGKEVTDTEHNTVSYKNWTSTNSKFPKVDTPVLEGYIADIASVGEEEATEPTSTGDVTNLTKEVVYTKLGSWVPRLPEGVTPPEGTDMTPKPYPNNPNDPTKPGDPTDPNVPVIPYVPGYTPNVGGTHLVPKNPTDLTEGYTPPTPTDPKTNIEINYTPDPQKAVVKVYTIRDGVKIELPNEKVSIDSGIPDAAIPSTKLDEKIKDLEKRGYTVENKEPLKGETFDKNKDPENGDPTQVFKLLVKERTVEVTTPPTPNTPVDPNIPDGPKWPETGLAKSDLEKEVTRTITYVKKETADGPEIADAKPTVKQTAHFKRSATYNAVTGTITYGNWESADKELAKVDTPELTGYVADKASVDKVETNADSTGLDQKVVYTKLGSWVPTPPAGVTPPTGTNFDPKPYPNHPTDPTKPGEPEYPQPGTPVEPNTPVIPYVPGYTPKTPDGNPLVPVDPEHPENGYKVPPVSTTPGEDTPITYEGNPQKALVKVVKVDGTTETPLTADYVNINGKTGDQIPTESVTAKIAELEKRGYVIDNRDEVVNYINNKFDKDKDTEGQDPTQTVTLKVHEKVVPVTPPTDDKPLEPGKPIDPDTPVDPNNPNDPTIPRWTDELIKKLDVKKEVTRTINYVDEAGNKVSEPSTDKVTFTREAKINVVTGEITYGDWKAVGGDSTFDKVSSPVVKGYILKDPAQKEVAERKGITPTVANQTIEVVYKKLGSWVPKVPGVETPTPLPYPNDPTDPTKPGDPTDPNVPVIPYVPGYTPKTPDGNLLVPKVPNDPTQGYIPPVPTEPGKDTPIEYVKVPNTPSPEEPVKPTPESNHITIWVDENGKPLKPEKPGTHEPGNIPGYRYITTVTKDGVTIHKFEKITPVDPNNPVPQKPTTPLPTPQDPTIPTPESQIPTPNTPEATTPTSETNRREELPNTGTEANASLASAGIMTLLAGLGLGFFKKKEDEK